METIYFSLGVVTALVAILFVMGVVMIVKLTKKQKNQETIIKNTINICEDIKIDFKAEIKRLDMDIHRMEERTIKNDDQLHRRIDELNRYVDSRYDKLLNKLNISSNDAKDLLRD